MSAPLQVLVVCTHNRARSVAMAALLDRECSRRGVAVEVTSAGFMPSGRPATIGMVDALAALELDVSAHRSRRIDPELVASADLILTAERTHVIRIAEDDATIFARTYTLPEFVRRAEVVGARGSASTADWLQAIADGRSPAGFLRAEIPEIPDPTGASARLHATVVAEIADLCVRLAGLW